MIKLHQLTSATRTRKSRVGRGIAAGQGKTAGRGTKGQKSRSGYNLPRKFEGGQTPLILRLPKVRGLKRHIGQKPITVDRRLINKHFFDGETVSPQTLQEKGLVDGRVKSIKVIGAEKLTVNVTFENVRQSRFKE